jgi:S1-C subfamily serine protease
MFKFLLAPFLAFASIFSQSEIELIDRVSESVVQIHGKATAMTFFGPTEYSYSCSGFVIAKDRVLTDEHCLGEDMTVDGISPVVIQKSVEAVDLALLNIHTDKPALTFRTTEVKRFSTVYSIGHGYGWKSITALKHRLLLFRNSPAEGYTPGLIVEGPFIGGMSGGPIVDEDGDVIGIVQASNQEIGYGVGWNVIGEFLAGTDVK